MIPLNINCCLLTPSKRLVGKQSYGAMQVYIYNYESDETKVKTQYFFTRMFKPCLHNVTKYAQRAIRCDLLVFIDHAN